MDATLAMTPDPPYTAVIFSSIRTDGDNGYAEMAEAMEELATRQPGYLGIESARDGVGIFVSYWRSDADASAWKAVAEHRFAQERGRRSWYREYQVRVATVVRAYGQPDRKAAEAPAPTDSGAADAGAIEPTAGATVGPTADSDGGDVVLIRPWTGPWPDDDPDANFKSDVALYSRLDAMSTVRNLSGALDIPVGGLVRYILAKWASGGSSALMELGPAAVNRLWEPIARAESDGSDAARLAAYDELRQYVSWLKVPLDDPTVYPLPDDQAPTT